MAHVAELQPEVIRQLRASLAITTLLQCVQELVANALDADASQIDVSFDAEKHSVRVDDDGIGILPSQLPLLAKRHVTSKCQTLEDLRRVRTLGYRGQALASLADIAILQIISKSRQCDDAQMAIWKDGRLIETSSSQPRQTGTTVVVRDLFYKYPIRRRIPNMERTNESIKRWIITMALAFPHIGFSLQHRDTKVLVSTKKRSSELNVLHRLYGHAFAQSMRTFEYNDDADIKLKALFGTISYPTKSYQYIYINRHHVPPTHPLYRTATESFAGSSIIKQPSKKGKGVVEKHPVFVIHVHDPNLSSYDVSLYLIDEHKVLLHLHASVQKLIANFLRVNNFISSTTYQQLVRINEPSTKRKKTVHPPSWLYNHDDGTTRDTINFIDRSRLRRTLTLSPGTPSIATHEPIRLAKEDLKAAAVLGQVDNKFILIKLQNQQLLLVDQHAADERVQLERMLWSLKDRAEETQLDPSIAIDLSQTDRQLVQKYSSQLARWGFRLSAVPDSAETSILRYSKYFSPPESSSSYFQQRNDRVLATRLPRLIADRCIVNRDMLRDLIREYLHWLDRTTQQQDDDDQEANSFTFLRSCPRGMMRILRSKACRGAVMFNDHLTTEQCCWLIEALAECRFPFQCVHGRPSMVPLITLEKDKPKRRKISWDRFCL
ncbi:histidine kinase-like ATPase [Fennellomyces sp. T-0311]|nr:histidine kinase-like ATPase [Fennellomyces sp. T-0311]